MRSSVTEGVALEGRDIFWKDRLPEELVSVHDTFHVSNLKKCLADANLHVPLKEIKVDKTLCFVEEPVEIMDSEIRSLKRSRISLVKNQLVKSQDEISLRRGYCDTRDLSRNEFEVFDEYSILFTYSDNGNDGVLACIATSPCV
ncbi:hypothetical protein Tco_0106135 [Tanacetum coccineum]